MRELHDDVRDGEGEEHEGDVEVDEPEPAEEAIAPAVNAHEGKGYARLRVRRCYGRLWEGRGAVGRR